MKSSSHKPKKVAEAIKFKNEQAAAKAEEERKKLDHERLKNLNDDWDEALGDLTILEKELETETDPEKRKITTEKISAKRARILGIANRIGKQQPGIEAAQKAEIDETAAAAKHTRTLDAEKAEETKEKADAEAKKQEALATLVKYRDIFSEKEYNDIKVQIELGDAVNVKDFTKKPPATVSGTTEEILDSYTGYTE